MTVVVGRPHEIAPLVIVPPRAVASKMGTVDVLVVEIRGVRVDKGIVDTGVRGESIASVIGRRKGMMIGNDMTLQ